MECEICGKRDAVCLVHIEGAKMNACAGCAQGGQILHYFDNEKQEIQHLPAMARTEEEIVDGYGKIIAEARMKMKLTIEELGLKIGEKANYIEHVEKEIMLPSLVLARKLEKFFRIKLINKEKTEATKMPEYKKKELTLLDVAEIKQKP